MKMEEHVEKLILMADAKALATYGEFGLNVVPVSTVKIVEGNIWLIDYFMGKTVENIQFDKSVSLVCWKDMFGFQIKGKSSYLRDGEQFEIAKNWIRNILPERTVKGLILIEPIEVFDIGPGQNSKEIVARTN